MRSVWGAGAAGSRPSRSCNRWMSVWMSAGRVFVQKSRKGPLGVQEPQIDPEQAVQPGDLEFLQGQVVGGRAGALQFHGQVPQLGALGAERLVAGPRGPRGERAHDVLEHLLALLRPLGPDGLGLLRVDVGAEFRMGPQEAQVADLAGQQHGQDDVGKAADHGQRRAGRHGQQVPTIEKSGLEIIAHIAAFYSTPERNCSSSRLIRSRR